MISSLRWYYILDERFRLLSPVLSGWIFIMIVTTYGCHLFREVYCFCATCRLCMVTVWSLSHCISEEIPVRCYPLSLVAVYYIRVALVLASDIFLVTLFRFPRYTDLCTWSSEKTLRKLSQKELTLRHIPEVNRN